MRGFFYAGLPIYSNYHECRSQLVSFLPRSLLGRLLAIRLPSHTPAGLGKAGYLYSQATHLSARRYSSPPCPLLSILYNQTLTCRLPGLSQPTLRFHSPRSGDVINKDFGWLDIDLPYSTQETDIILLIYCTFPSTWSR